MLQNAVATPADRAFAEHLDTLATPPRVVLDTNVWIDLLVFDDPVARPVRDALVERRLRHSWRRAAATNSPWC